MMERARAGNVFAALLATVMLMPSALGGSTSGAPKQKNLPAPKEKAWDMSGRATR